MASITLGSGVKPADFKAHQVRALVNQLYTPFAAEPLISSEPYVRTDIRFNLRSLNLTHFQKHSDERELNVLVEQLGDVLARVPRGRVRRLRVDVLVEQHVAAGARGERGPSDRLQQGRSGQAVGSTAASAGEGARTKKKGGGGDGREGWAQAARAQVARRVLLRLEEREQKLIVRRILDLNPSAEGRGRDGMRVKVARREALA